MYILTKTAAAVALTCLFSLPALANETVYEVTHRIELGSVTKWDYAAIDAARQRLYVTRGDRVDVVQLPSGTPVGSIPNTQGVHGVAFAPALKRGFTSNGKSNSVTVFDLDTLKTTGEISLPGKNPDAILYEAAVKKIYVFNGSSNTVDVIDVATLKVVASLQASGRPEFAVSDGKGKIYFNIEDHAGINVIDTVAGKISAQWVLAGCDEPTGLAIDSKNARLFSSCQNKIAVVTDANSGKRVAEFAIGEHPDALVFDEDTKTVLTSCGGGTGTLTVTVQVDANHYETRQHVVTEPRAKTMAFNAKDKMAYLPTVVGDKFIVVAVSKKN